MSVYPFIEAEKVQQRKVKRASVRAAEGLPCRLLRRPGRAALGPGPPGRRPDRADHGRAQTVQRPVRRAADPRGAAARAGGIPVSGLPGCAPARLAQPGGEAVEEDHHPGPDRDGPG